MSRRDAFDQTTPRVYLRHADGPYLGTPDGEPIVLTPAEAERLEAAVHDADDGAWPVEIHRITLLPGERAGPRLRVMRQLLAAHGVIGHPAAGGRYAMAPDRYTRDLVLDLARRRLAPAATA